MRECGTGFSRDQAGAQILPVADNVPGRPRGDAVSLGLVRLDSLFCIARF
jgi:hypothetical protein